MKKVFQGDSAQKMKVQRVSLVNKHEKKFHSDEKNPDSMDQGREMEQRFYTLK